MSIVLVKFVNLESLRGFYGGACVTDFMADAAEFCKDLIRRLDITCCYGKDGFGIILPTTGATAAVVLARLQSKFGPWLVQRRGPTGTVGVQCGYAFIEDTHKTWHDLLSEAEAMLSTSVSEQEAA